MTESIQTPDAETADASASQKRDRSTVEFPYSDLDSAIEIARTVHNKAGNTCEITQLAGWLGQSAKGGTFRSRLSAARLFGLIETERGGTATLSSLGREILDAGKEHDARVIAFMRVELYRSMYKLLKGYNLPPPAALESQAITFGVAPKQAERARQVFAKSAEQAHFIDQQSGRFVKPGMTVSMGPTAEEEKGQNGSELGNGDNGDDPQLDPSLHGLVDRLPRGKAASWPVADRATWLRAVITVFDVVYGRDGEISIDVTMPNQEAPETAHDLIR